HVLGQHGDDGFVLDQQYAQARAETLLGNLHPASTESRADSDVEPLGPVVEYRLARQIVGAGAFDEQRAETFARRRRDGDAARFAPIEIQLVGRSQAPADANIAAAAG